MSHLSHLRTFLEAYRSGSFSKAAELLGITQPAASQHIQSLETLVGKRLFIRQARGVTATEAADELARSVSPFIDGLEEKLSSFRSGSVRVTNGAIVIHTQRLKSDPGGNLLS
ncbi:LysR family transcriptional regulator [Escherichia coli]|nr:LysR family transcriptional regulator [Escherichia coli]